ncbi:NUDIX hydrolase [Brevibacillus laterosporus]|uniref:Coenzyme A pyrophosphatase n=1 Tax=Brevibacillus laterosporus TaxID=1465 RepID=A0AAP8U7B5_BRELA|nr:CoA pyrophosphatase [Brevibacillus laterosporus]PPB13123.1 coenzyme A pyrophosphatase [Brevibacillus laterosporus]
MDDRQIESVIKQISTRQRGILGQEESRRTAVLVPLIRNERGEWSILFEKRASTLRSQAGEICFPGGHIEPSDHNEWEAARRETSEELALDPDKIMYAGDLDILVLSSSLLIYPYVGFVHTKISDLTPNPDEVEEVFAVSLQTLLGTIPDRFDIDLRFEPGEDFPYHLIANGRNYKWRHGKLPEYFYEAEGHIIWGLTARILMHFLQFFRKQSKK